MRYAVPGTTLTVALVATAACSSFQPSGRSTPTVGQAVRIEAGSRPLTVAVRASPESPTFQYCEARLVQGYVSAVLADTVIFRELTRVDPSVAFDSRCRSSGAARLVLGSGGAMISEERGDRRRTLGAIAMGAFLAAMLASTL